MDIKTILYVCGIIAIIGARVYIASLGKDAKSVFVTTGSITCFIGVCMSPNKGGVMILISAVFMGIGLVIALLRKNDEPVLTSPKNVLSPFPAEAIPAPAVYNQADIGYQEPAEPTRVMNSNPNNEGFSGNMENLMCRGYLSLEDKDYKSASTFFNRVLDQNAQYAPAYIGLMLCGLRLQKEEQLSGSLVDFEETPEWKKAYRFASDRKVPNFLLRFPAYWKK